jgi:hypothetical protein
VTLVRRNAALRHPEAGVARLKDLKMRGIR